MPKGVYIRTEEAKANISASRKAYSRTEEGKAQLLKIQQAAHTPEACAKVSAALTGRSLSEECKAKISASCKAYRQTQEGRVQLLEAQQAAQTPEARARQRAALQTPEVKARMSMSHRGQEVSEEARAKISAALTGRTFSEEHKAKISAALIGHEVSEEVCARLSVIAKQKAETPEGRAALLKAARASQMPEVRARINASRKAYLQTEEGKASLLKALQAARTVRPTNLERALYKMLDVFGWVYDTEVSFPPYFVDAYIPCLHLGIEADGPFHFKGNPLARTTAEEEIQRTMDRDARLLEVYDLSVLHFTEEQLAQYYE